LEALDQHPHVLHTLRGKSPVAIMGALGHPGVSPEGEFFPDTYRFAANTPDIAILTLAYDSMQRVLADAWTQRRPGLPYDTPYQALTLASMVEKEAALKSERAQIAGVFVNRLRKRMRLQSDPKPGSRRPRARPWFSRSRASRAPGSPRSRSSPAPGSLATGSPCA